MFQLLLFCACLGFTTRVRAFSAPMLPPHILVHGEMLFDYLGEPGMPVQKMIETGRSKRFPGGAPANVATALSKLGSPVAFAGAIGDDMNGNSLWEILMDHDINTDMVITADDRVTRAVLVTRNYEGERKFAGFGGGIKSKDFADAHYELPKDPHDVQWLVQGTLGLAFEKSRTAHHKMTDIVLKQGGYHLLDVNWRDVFFQDSSNPDWEQLARTDILSFAQTAKVVKCTDEEAEWLGASSCDPAVVRRELFPNAAGVLVTAGEKGAAFDVLGHTGMIEGFHVEAVDTTGAGDGFTAGILHRLKTFDWENQVMTAERRTTIDDAVRFGCAVGALTCMKEGAIAGQPSYEDVEAFLKKQPVYA